MLITIAIVIFIHSDYSNSVYAAAVSWDGGASTTNWSDANNWSNDAVPTNADDVTINQNVTVNIASTTTVNSLVLGQNGGGTTPTLNFSYDAVAQGALIIDDGNLTIYPGATVTHSAGNSVVVGKIYIDVQTGDASVLGTINVVAKGYQPTSGPTPGGSIYDASGGGGHGGTGSNGGQGTGSGGISGSVTAPIEMGSGGGTSELWRGAFGGGVVRLNIAGSLNVGGSITVNGGNYVSTGYQPGGGAGGSLYITTGTFTGAGTISANGGNGYANGGGGGGGRIAIHMTTNTYSGSITAYGGTGYSYGGAGTIFTKLSSQTYGSLLLDNNNYFTTTTMDDRYLGRTPLPSITLDSLTIRNYAIFENQNSATVVSATTNWSTKGIIVDSGGTFALISSGGSLTVPSTAYLFANTARTFSSLTVNGTITTSYNSTSLVYKVDYTVNGDLTVAASGSINMFQRGYRPNAGPSAGGNGASLDGLGGGGHGGTGGTGWNFSGGDVSDSLTMPSDMGSGGGVRTTEYWRGAYGGGAIRLDVTGTTSVSGSILANGGNYANAGYNPGGGAGGSIYITTGTFSGAGTIAANGGNGASGGGGGGGGRIAIHMTTNNYTGSTTAYGGTGRDYGGAGTVYTKLASQTYGSVLIDNNNQFNTTTTDDRIIGVTKLNTVTLDSLIIRNYAILKLQESTTLISASTTWNSKGIIKDDGGTFDLISGGGSLIVPDTSYLFANTPRTYTSVVVNGRITTSYNTTSPVYRVDITSSGDFTISSTGVIAMGARGYMGGYGPTPGLNGLDGQGGAGHGGTGGSGNLYGGGNISGTLTTPTELGSGGGSRSDSYLGGYGGGAIKLTVSGQLVVSGVINANGGNYVTASYNPGGGAGGSVYIITNSISGAGSITANGGNGASNGGGGGGGRIALHMTTNSFTGTISAYGGTGYAYGGAGTIFTKLAAQTYGSVVIDNNNQFSISTLTDRYIGNTPLNSTTIDSLTIRNYGILNSVEGSTIVYSSLDWATKGIIKDSNGTFDLLSGGGDITIPATSVYYANTARTFNNVIVNGTVTSSNNSTTPTYRVDLTANGSINIAASGLIDVNLKGYQPSSGPTPGLGGFSEGQGGGGHGGAGANGLNFAGGTTSGTALAPTELGSGGGIPGVNEMWRTNAYGGGAVKLNASGTLTINGTITSNGGTFTNSGYSPGGGAGGSVYLIGSTIAGSGPISANGGAGYGSNGGGGGGGRVNLVFQSKTYSGSVTVNGGASTRAGSVGTFVETNIPNQPSELLQYKSNGSTVIPSAGTTTETTVVLKVSMASAINQSLTPQFEVRTIDTAFSNSATHTGAAVAYSGTPVNGTVSVEGLADSTNYHWQARVCNSTNQCSNWVSFDGNPYDFRIFTNSNPYSPTSLGPVNLLDGSTTNDSTPTFTFTLTDPDAPNNVSYLIQVATDNAFSNVIVEYSSADAAQGARSFTVGQTLDGGVYIVGSIGQTLTDGSYYWQVKSIDESGAESGWSVASAVTPAFVLDTSDPNANATNVELTNATAGEWTGLEPNITWDAGQDLAGNILGYCIALSEVVSGGAEPNDNPLNTAGVLNGFDDGVTNAECPYIVTTDSFDISTVAGLTLTSDKDYYFSIAAIDTAGNVYQANPVDYQNLVFFKYDGIAPVNVSSISAAGGTFTDIAQMYFSWPTSGPSAASDTGGSGLLGYQYSINGQDDWKGVQVDSLTGYSFIPTDTTLPFYLDETRDSNVTIGNNIVSFRTVDIAGNISSPATYRLASLSFGGQAPTFPGDAQVTVTPNVSDNNSFSIAWDEATPSQGRTIASYYYMINVTPPVTLATMTGNSATYFATGTDRTVSTRQLPGVVKGSNTVYVVVADDAGQYSPSSVISVNFTLNSENPDPPKNFSVSDSSIKEAELWRASLVWDVPDYVGAGNLTYRVQRSTDGVTWQNVGNTTGNSYVDTVPTSTNFYWRVGATDPSDDSIQSPSYTNAVALIPRGSYTSPADLTSGPVSTEITTKRAKILWTTSRTSDSKVAYGTTPGEYLEEEPSNSSQVTDHTINLTNLNPDTTYYYVAKWTDEDGNTGISEEKLFRTEAAPIIKEVTMTNVSLNSAILNFTIINGSSVKVYYGVTTDFGGAKTIETSRQESSYSTILDNLSDGTKYYLRINGIDSEGEEYTGDIYSFETLPRPKVTNIKLQQVANTAQTTVLVTWRSNTAITSVVTVFPTETPSADRDIVDLKLKTGEHSMVVSSLQPATRYTLLVKGLDKLGNQAVSAPLTFTTSIDTRPPALLNTKVIGGTVPPVGFAAGTINAQLVISWDTDEPATSQVEFGEGTGTTYSQKTVLDGNLTTNHVVVVSGLTPSKVYHIRAISVDAAGNESKSVDIVTIAPKATQSALDLVILNLRQIFGGLEGL